MILSAHRKPLKTHTENITDLMVNMKFMVLPSLQWPVQICVTLNSIVLQDIAPWHGKVNSVYYSRYTHTHREQCQQLLFITQLLDKWDHGLETTCRIQKTMFIQENTSMLWARKEVWVWVAQEILKQKNSGRIFLSSRTCWLLHFYT